MSLDSFSPKLSLSGKLTWIFSSSLLGMAIILFLFYQGLKESLIQEKKEQASILSETGLSLIKHYHSLSLASEEDSEYFKQSALNSLESLTFGENGYFWVNDSTGMMLMHPHVKHIVHTNVLKFEDKHGMFIFPEFIKVAKNGGGVVTYHWTKPNSSEAVPKMSHVSFFGPWNWVLGTGIYIDEMEQQVTDYAVKAITIVIIFALIFIFSTMYFIKSLVHKLNTSAIKDPLTHLYTRRYLTETSPDLIRKIERDEGLYLSVIYMDIDHFKKINDTYGHGKGDEVISLIGKSILKLTRPDDLAFRYGGEEFLIVSISDNPRTAHLLIDRIRQEVGAKEFNNHCQKFSVTLSAGISIHNRMDDLEKTISKADVHLYEAKEAGRDRVVYEGELSL